jgi:hypothetical protein
MGGGGQDGAGMTGGDRGGIRSTEYGTLVGTVEYSCLYSYYWQTQVSHCGALGCTIDTTVVPQR